MQYIPREECIPISPHRLGVLLHSAVCVWTEGDELERRNRLSAHGSGVRIAERFTIVW